ncbi:MAG TPA: phosphoribosylanthranilate isomerase [Polyangia bacterium]|jgi:phosphoribosylanthranilate isomerase|nr:phosphoribosylanthranilate isomerase [Polyangia bacterium]
MSRRFLIKICGITTPEDAAAAAAAGADAVGINFWPGSKRFIGSDVAAHRVAAAIPTGILKVGVFVNANLATVLQTLATFGLDRVQLHGDESAADFAALDPARLIRAVRVRGEGSFAEAAAWPPGLRLYDAFVDGFGGGGMAAPWELVARLAVQPFILAGGLTPANVAAAIAAVGPDGVDVASGVEHAPGRKDATKMAAFVEAARAAVAAAADTRKIGR